MSISTSFTASRRSDLARRLRRLTSMLAESTTRFSTFLGQEEAMEPEAVAAGLVARGDRGVLGEAEPLLGGLDLGQQSHGVAGRDRPEPGLLAQADGEGQLPRAGTQFQSHVKHRGRYSGTIVFVGRCHG